MVAEPPMPTEPRPTEWRFPSIETRDPDGQSNEAAQSDGPLAIGADLLPGTLLEAYRNGYFPMPLAETGPMGWWSPDPRGIIEVVDYHVSRSLRRSMRHFYITVNTAFDAVVEGCADPRRAHGWINEAIRDAYTEMHRLGWAHSVEVWMSGELVGGLYGIGIGAFFAGESMFHTHTDASKAAVAGLVERLSPTSHALFDVQWATPHLISIGAVEVGRTTYMARLRRAVSSSPLDWPAPAH